MIGGIAKKLFGSANDRYVKSLQGKVQQIAALEPQLARMTDEELRGRTTWLRERHNGGESLDNLLVDAFATVREAGKRALGMRHFDVQLVGGMVLHKGMIAEMRTGEGKTLVCTLAAYLNALPGKGVHVVTVNDYLAKRDSEWMGRLHQFLGLTVGCITHDMDDEERKAAYACDITYATNNELGFDYLRDNMKFVREEMVHRPFHYAIVDEVDSILIDEARTPLIISGPTEDNSELYNQVDKLVHKLVPADFEKDEKHRSVTLTEAGVHHMEALLSAAKLMPENTSLYDIEHVSLVHHVNQALRAHTLFAKDVDYIVKDNKVVIIDEFTGRMMEGRRYSEGLHQALEAKEGVRIQNENQTLASITFQNLFRMYPKLSGMTGTAMTEAGEFRDIYKLEVIDIPTNMPVSRIDHQDEIYRTAGEKYRAIVIQIAECLMKGQPVLVGTASIEKSEYLSALLKDKKYLKETAKNLAARASIFTEQARKLSGKAQEDAQANAKQLKEASAYLEEAAGKSTPIPHQVLNARYHEQEAQIIAQAGRMAAVTIATNMAGRGTDIMLGGNPDMLVAQQAGGMEDGVEKNAIIGRITAEVEQAKEKVREAGGLMVIGTERHESRRIDNQLRGRSGRQGDPGGSKFFLSLEDDLMRIFGSERIDGLLQRLGMKEDEAIFHPWMTKAIERAQQKVEQRNYEIRKNLLKFDDVMNDQRKVIYEQRIELMEAESVGETVGSMREEINQGMVGAYIPARSYPDTWQTEDLQKEIFRVYGLHLPVTDWAKEEGIADEELLKRINEVTEQHFSAKTVRYGESLMRMAEKRVLLQTLDQVWKDHLLSLDHLRQGIQLRGYGQRDPLNEYKQEAFTLFEQMLNLLRELVVSRLSHLEIHVEQPMAMPQPQQKRMFESREDPALAARKEAGRPFNEQRTGRNEACPCGSGKKFKHCHGALE
ncbi:MAG: preprotein translocase subunit SecA [Proteobacteria bacterium]|nr:preprotein translocase subunit SecA [Pseudomonadota bacterium]